MILMITTDLCMPLLHIIIMFMTWQCTVLVNKLISSSSMWYSSKSLVSQYKESRAIVLGSLHLPLWAHDVTRVGRSVRMSNHARGFFFSQSYFYSCRTRTIHIIQTFLCICILTYPFDNKIIVVIVIDLTQKFCIFNRVW